MYINQFNKHWKKDFFYNISFKRDYYEKLLAKLENKYIINLIWLRRVGKTTLLKQFIDYLLEKKEISRKNIFFYSFDYEQDLEEKVEAYKKITQIDFEKEKVFIFLDEIQKVPNWQARVKVYYDLYPNIKFIVSGSSSLYLQKQESLAGRMEEYYIKTLYFPEFLRFKKLDYYLQEKNIYKDELLYEFEKYIFRQFIDIVDSDEEEVHFYINSLINKVIKEDISLYFKIEFPDLLIKIFRIISANPWMILDYKNFSNDLDIDQRTLEKYIYYLEEAFLVKKIYNYSANLIKTERKLKKIYVETTSFCPIWELTWEIFENYILQVLQAEYFYRYTDKEVDFIEVKNKNSLNPKLIWYEVKYKNKIKKQDSRGLIHFDKKYNLQEKIIISKSIITNIEWIKIINFMDL